MCRLTCRKVFGIQARLGLRLEFLLWGLECSFEKRLKMLLKDIFEEASR